MMSGRSPFLGHSKSETSGKSSEAGDSVSSIIRRIKHGDFRMDSDAWKYVSPAPKSLIKGLLTVEVKKRLTMDALLSSSWINSCTQNNNNNPPSLLMTPLVLNDTIIDRSLKQTFNAYHTVARELNAASMLTGSCLFGVNARSSSISSSSSSLSSSGSGGGASSISSSGAIRANLNSKAVQEYLQSQQFLHNTAHSSHNNASTFLAAATEAAFTGVSYQLMPAAAAAAAAAYMASSNSSVSITKMGPMTRSRKRKMQDIDSSVSITPTFSRANDTMASASGLPVNPATSAASLEIVTVTKRERTTNDSAAMAFPLAAPSTSGSNLQYCATARAVVVKNPASAATCTWTTVSNGSAGSSLVQNKNCLESGSNSRPVTITID